MRESVCLGLGEPGSLVPHDLRHPPSPSHLDPTLLPEVLGVYTRVLTWHWHTVCAVLTWHWHTVCAAPPLPPARALQTRRRLQPSAFCGTCLGMQNR
eukprot:3496044-Rhodomonas_salina.1